MTHHSPTDKLPFMPEFYTNHIPKQWTGVEVDPVAFVMDGDMNYFERVEQDEEAFCFSVYLRSAEGRVDCIADFETRAEAEAFADFIKRIATNYVNK